MVGLVMLKGILLLGTSRDLSLLRRRVDLPCQRRPVQMRTGQYLPGRQNQDRELQLKETGRSITPEDLGTLDFKGFTKDITNPLLPRHKIGDQMWPLL